jgi:triacylglycerol lipase
MDEQDVPITEKERSRSRKILFVIGLIVLALAVLQILISAGLTFRSITAEDLALFVQPAEPYQVVQHNEEFSVSYTLGVNNLAFCTATCNWSIVDQRSQTVLAQGTDRLVSGQKHNYSANVTAPARGLSTSTYQFLASCQNNEGQYCKSRYEERQAAAIAIVNITYTDDEEDLLEDLQEKLPAWSEERRQVLNKLAGISQVTDRRVQQTAEFAKTEQTSLLAQTRALSLSLSAGDITRSTELLNAPAQAASVTTYEQAVQQEQLLVQRYNELVARQNALSVLYFAVNAQERGQLTSAVSRVQLSRTDFALQSLDATDRAFATLTDLMNSLELTYAEKIISAANNGTALVEQELFLACTLKNGSCPQERPEVETVTEAYERMAGVCADMQALPSTFKTYHNAYAMELNETATVTEVEEQYGVAVVQARENFGSFAAGVREAGRARQRATTNPAERLAVPLQVSADTLQFNTTWCGEAPQLQPAAITPLLPSVFNATVDLPSFTLPEPSCCSLGNCSACVQHRYPVIFVHGHSFADATQPEYSLLSFTPYALKLQDEGYLYAGHVFPDENVKIPTGVLGGMPTGVTFTTTYYYNSYPEEGQTSFIIQKSTGIENYALRLREAVRAAKQQTGSDKVVLVAHSMGGLVSRKYIQIFGEEDVAALIMIGTPNHGISGRTQDLCPVFGGEEECLDMEEGSLFLNKLNGGVQPTIPVYTIAGTGCDGDTDGVVSVSSVTVPFGESIIVNGTCPSNYDLLHNTMIQPHIRPDVYSAVRDILDTHTRQMPAP